MHEREEHAIQMKLIHTLISPLISAAAILSWYLLAPTDLAKSVNCPLAMPNNIETTHNQCTKHSTHKSCPTYTLYHTTERTRFIRTCVHLKLTIIKSRYGSLEVTMVNSMTSVTSAFNSAKRKSWMNSREKCLNTLVDCWGANNIHGLFQCQVRHRLDTSRLVHHH